MPVHFSLRNGSLLILLSLFAFHLSAQLPGPGTCIGFIAAGQQVSVPHHPTLMPTAGITIEGWILPFTTPPLCCDNILVDKADLSVGMNGYQVHVNNSGDLNFVLTSNGSADTARAANALNFYSWNHFAATYDGSNMRVFINGVEEANKAHTGNISLNSDSLRLADDYRGEMDEVRIWSTALSQSTIRDWMCKKYNGTHPNAVALRAYWNFDDVSGTTLTDAGGPGNNGVVVGAPMWGPSSVPLGDSSVNTYGNLAALQILGPPGDTFLIDNWTGSPEGVHLYMVEMAPSVDTFQTGVNYYSKIDTGHYFGYFFVPSPFGNPQSDIHYYYNNNPFFFGQQECEAAMALRLHAAYPWWNPIFGVGDAVQKVVNYYNIGRGEFIPALMANPYGTLAIPDTDACQGDSILLLTGNGQGLTYQWYLNGAPIPNATNDSLYVSTNGYYQIHVTDSNCTYSSDSMELVFNALPQISLAQADSLWECEGSLDLAGLASPAGGMWSGNGVVGDTFFTAMAGLGASNLSYGYTDANGCANSASITIEVEPDPTPSLNVQPDLLCEQDSAIGLAGSGFPGGGVYSGSGTSGQLFDPASAGAGMHIIQYQLAISGTSCNFQASDTVTVLPAPPAPLVTLSNDTLFSSDPATDWYFQSSPNDIFLGSGSFWVPSSTGNYYAVTVGQNGCLSAPSPFLNVLVALENAFPMVWTICPNPVADILQIENLEMRNHRISVFDGQGSIVMERAITEQGNGKITMDVAHLPAGLYFLVVENEWGDRSASNFLKK